MKHTKKFAGLLLALVMMLALAAPAFAAGTNTITVNNAQANETYNIYKMLDLIVNEDQTAYSYTVNENWKDFFTGSGAGAAYVNIDTLGYVTWEDGKDTAADMEAFGKVLLLMPLPLLITFPLSIPRPPLPMAPSLSRI